jgi:hypothetical protein
MFRMTPGGACEIKIGETEWMGYQVTVPACVDSRWNGRMSKPRFIRTRGGRWECLVSLELDPDPPVPSDDGVLGLDLGLVKPYSASAVYPDGRVSQEQVESHRLATMQAKLTRLKHERERLWEKYDRSRRLRGWQPNPGMDASYAGVKRRITRLKHESAVQVSREVVEAARRLHCGVVHAERLSWLDSRGGRWDHSAVQTEVEDRLSRAGVRFERVSAAYSSSEDPITGERGSTVGRDIVYGDGSRVDRDRLAGVNLACRPARKSKTKREPATQPKGHPTPRRVRLATRVHSISLNKNSVRTVLIVTARRRVLGDARTAPPPRYERREPIGRCANSKHHTCRRRLVTIITRFEQQL